MIPMVARRRTSCWSISKRRFQAVEDALRQFGRLVGLLDVGLDQGELVAAQARQRTEPRLLPAQAVGEGDQQLVAELVGVLLVDPLEIVEAQAQHCHPARWRPAPSRIWSSCCCSNWRFGRPVRKSYWECAAGCPQPRGAGGCCFRSRRATGWRWYPEPQLVAFVPLEQRQLVLAGAVGIDADQVFDDLRQRLGPASSGRPGTAPGPWPGRGECRR